MVIKELCVSSCVCLISLFSNTYACTIINDSNKVKRIDITDVFHKILNRNYRIDTSCAKVNEKLFSILPGIGYSQLTGFSIGIANNVSFYTSKNKTANISSINFIPEYWQNKQFTSNLFSSIWSNHNKYNLTLDWRYYKYLIKDYGLNNNSRILVFKKYQFQFLRLHQALLRSIRPDLLIGLGYNFDYHYKIISNDTINNKKFSSSSIEKSTVSSGLTFNALYDTRRNENSPVANGWYISMIFTQNLKFLRSTSNYNSIYFDIRHYIAFPKKSKNILAIWNINWFTLGNKAPYFDKPSTLWDNYNHAGRTFIQGRFRGRNMIYYEAEYRFNILKNELLGAALFANVQNFSKANSPGFSKALPGYGASLRVLVNKKSRVHFVVSYGAGVGGAKGFLFNLGEMF